MRVTDADKPESEAAIWWKDSDSLRVRMWGRITFELMIEKV